MTVTVIRPNRVFYPDEIVECGRKQVQAISFVFEPGDIVRNHGRTFIVLVPGYYSDAGLEEIVYDDSVPYATKPPEDGR